MYIYLHYIYCLQRQLHDDQVKYLVGILRIAVIVCKSRRIHKNLNKLKEITFNIQPGNEDVC